MDVAEEDFMPLSHQLGRIAHVQPFHLQGMKTSVLYDDEDEENRPTPKTMLRSKSLFSNKSIFNSSYIDNKQTTFTKLDTSKSTSLAQDTLNNSVFLNVTSEKLTNVGNSAKIQKKSHLFKSGLSLQNSFGMKSFLYIILIYLLLLLLLLFLVCFYFCSNSVLSVFSIFHFSSRRNKINARY